MDNTNITFLHDDDVEKGLIGDLMYGGSAAFSNVAEIVDETMFFNEKCRHLFVVIKKICESGEQPNIMTVWDYAQKKRVNVSAEEIAELASCTRSEEVREAKIVSELSLKRKMAKLGMRLIEVGGDWTSDPYDIMKKLSDFSAMTCDKEANTIVSAKDVQQLVLKRIDDNINGNIPIGTMTGFSKIDDLGGLQPSNLIVIAADSSQGKTSFATSIAINAALYGDGIAFYSLEMTAQQLMTRVTSVVTGISSLDLWNKKLKEEQVQMVVKESGRIEKLPIYFDERSNSNISVIVNSIKRMKAKYGIKGAIIDYLQIVSMNTRDKNSEQVLGEVARTLKNLAKEYDIWIIALSQISRDLDNPMPTTNRMRGSGQINEASDITVLLYRPDYYNKRFGKDLSYPKPYENIETEGTAMVNIAKGRFVGTTSFICQFDEKTTAFKDLPHLPFKHDKGGDKKAHNPEEYSVSKPFDDSLPF